MWSVDANVLTGTAGRRNKSRQNDIPMSSFVSTPAKSQQLLGLVEYWLTRTKNFKDYDSVTILDTHCGRGTNFLKPDARLLRKQFDMFKNESEDLNIDGSPVVSMIACYKVANSRGGLRIPVHLVYNDTNSETLKDLQKRITLLRQDLNPSHHNIISYTTRHGEANDAIIELKQQLIANPRLFAIIVVDPNRASDMPCDALANLMSHPRLARRVLLTIHTNATCWKREAGSQKKRLGRALTDLRAFIESLNVDPDACWIRKKLESDPWQWFMIVFFPWPPGHEWKSQRYVLLSSKDGQDAFEHYCLTNEEKELIDDQQ